MESRIAVVAGLLDRKARRIQREADELRRLAAELRESVATQDTPGTEDTEDHAD